MDDRKIEIKIPSALIRMGSSCLFTAILFVLLMFAKVAVQWLAVQMQDLVRFSSYVLLFILGSVLVHIIRTGKPDDDSDKPKRE